MIEASAHEDELFATCVSSCAGLSLKAMNALSEEGKQRLNVLLEQGWRVVVTAELDPGPPVVTIMLALAGDTPQVLEVAKIRWPTPYEFPPDGSQQVH